MADSGGEKKKVVVIGGGVAGSLIARSLQDEANVTLIDMKEYFEMPWAALRSMCDPSFAKRSIFSHSEYLPHGNVITSAATNITDTEVVTTKGDKVPYDFAVIATGHSENGAYTKDEKFSQYQTDHEKIKSANSILIIGGGQTGVELAAEIVVDYPDKKVTIVHRGSMLLEFIGECASNKVVNWLKSRKVEIILGQSVDVTSVKDGVYKTSGGQTIDADCHFICIGKPIGSAWLKETVLKDSLDIHGRLMVDSKLKVKGHNNIFGIGDITDIPISKRGESVEEKIKKLDVELARYKEQLKKTRPGPAQEAVKARAMRVLKQKRMYEGQLDMLYNQTYNLDQVSFAAEGIKDAQQTMAAMKSANKELKGMMKTVNIQDVDNLQDEMTDLMDVSNEIQETLGRSYSVPDDVDEEELMGELDALEADMEFEGDGVPSYLQPDKEPDLDSELNMPSAPTGHAPMPAGRANTQAEDELGLPAVPRASLRG